MNFKHPKLLGFVQFLVLFLVYLFLNLAYWPYALDIQADSMQTAAIRVTGSLVYYPTTIGFISSLAVLGLLIFGCGFLLLPQPLINLNILSKFTIIIEIFLHYFFWVFSIKYAPNFAELIRVDFIVQTVIRFIVILTCYFILRLIHVRQQTKEIHLSPMPVLQYECPFCHKQYLSNVKFCTKCNQFISVIEKKEAENG